MAAPTGVGLFHKILVLFITPDTKFALIMLNDLGFGLKLRLLACVSFCTNFDESSVSKILHSFAKNKHWTSICKSFSQIRLLLVFASQCFCLCTCLANCSAWIVGPYAVYQPWVPADGRIANYGNDTRRVFCQIAFTNFSTAEGRMLNDLAYFDNHSGWIANFSGARGRSLWEWWSSFG